MNYRSCTNLDHSSMKGSYPDVSFNVKHCKHCKHGGLHDLCSHSLSSSLNQLPFRLPLLKPYIRAVVVEESWPVEPFRISLVTACIVLAYIIDGLIFEGNGIVCLAVWVTSYHAEAFRESDELFVLRSRSL